MKNYLLSKYPIIYLREYIFIFLTATIFLFITLSKSFSQESVFTINNVQVEGRVDLNFSREKYLNKAFSNSFEILMTKILLTRDLKKMNDIVINELPIDEIMVCSHIDSDNCNCRKPKPGMIISLAKKWEITLEDSFLIGDNWKDIESGKAAGCRTILIDKLYNKTVTADYQVENLTMSAEVVKSHFIRTTTT